MSFISRFNTKLFFVLFLMPLVACQAETATKPVEISVDETKYTTLETPLSVSTGDKIEVVELFWYGCGHCFSLEPSIKKWHEEKMPANAEFVKVPAMFSKPWVFHAKAYYAMESLGVLEQANDAFFKRIHVLKKPINNITKVADFLKAYDITEEQVEDAFNSFAVDSKLRNAQRITVGSQSRGVPAILIDGKYLTSVQTAGGVSQLFEIINQLIAKAAAER